MSGEFKRAHSVTESSGKLGGSASHDSYLAGTNGIGRAHGASALGTQHTNGSGASGGAGAGAGAAAAASAGAGATEGVAISRSLSSPPEDDEVSHLPPLLRFTRAKTEVAAIFTSFLRCLAEAGEFLAKPLVWVDTTSTVHTETLDMERATVASAAEKVKNIAEAVGRKSMKVVFIGRTSNGKSSTINAMLHSKILPSGRGHTTNCFCALSGTDGDTPYVLLGDSEEKKDILDIKQLANALCENHLSADNVVDIHWPRERCRLLNADVVIIDSPGLDISANLDEWIDTHCSDADVFILVANAEATLNATEKNFFHRVKDKLSKPNIFIQYNRWDVVASADDDDDTPLDLVFDQHRENAANLLVKELGLIDEDAVQDRVFFVSAKEVLARRLQPAAAQRDELGLTTDSDAQSRYKEFERFERAFEECISTSAIHTRFQAHVEEGLEMAQAIADMLRGLARRTDEREQEMRRHLSEQKRRLDVLRSHLESSRRDCQELVANTSVNTKSTVAAALMQEIENNLQRTVADFKGLSLFDPDDLSEYKMAFNRYMDTEFGTRLQQRCSEAIDGPLHDARATLYNLCQEMLPFGLDIRTLVPEHHNKMDFRIECEALTDNFQEDIEFHFSLSLNNLSQRFLGHNDSLPIMSLFARSSGAMTSKPPATPGTVAKAQSQALSLDSVADFLQSPMGAVTLTVGSMLLSRSFTVKLFMWGCVIYGGLYAYERMCFTKTAQERRFKNQFVAHARGELERTVRHCSSYCSQGVERDLRSQMDELFAHLEKTQSQLERDIATYDEELVILQRAAKDSERLRSESAAQSLDLQRFKSRFL